MFADGSPETWSAERVLRDDDDVGSFNARTASFVDTRASLSSVDAARLAGVLARLLSPDALVDADAWRQSAAKAIRDLVDADAACMALESDGRRFTTIGLNERLVAEYQAHFARVDHGIARQRARKLSLWARRMLWGQAELASSEYYNDFAKPHRLLDTIGVAAFDPRGSMRLSLIYSRPIVRSLDSDGAGAQLRLLDLARPAFHVGAAMTLRWEGHQDLLAQVVDRVSRPLALCAASGRVVHQNPELTRAVSLDPVRLPEIIRTVAQAVATSTDARRITPASAQDICQEYGQWSVVGSRLEWEFGGLMPTVLVSLVRNSADRLPHELQRDQQERLQSAYGLTPRQLEVLAFLRLRRSNAEIARALQISEHTARHHTETVLAKLGVHSRAEVEEQCARFAQASTPKHDIGPHRIENHDGAGNQRQSARD